MLYHGQTEGRKYKHEQWKTNDFDVVVVGVAATFLGLQLLVCFFVAFSRFVGSQYRFERKDNQQNKRVRVCLYYLEVQMAMCEGMYVARKRTPGPSAACTHACKRTMREGHVRGLCERVM